MAYVDEVKDSPLCEDCKKAIIGKMSGIMAGLHKEDSPEEDFQQKLDGIPAKKKEVEVAAG